MVWVVVKEAETKIYRSGNRHYLYLPTSLVNDSAFPLKVNVKLIAKIEGEHLVIKKIPK